MKNIYRYCLPVLMFLVSCRSTRSLSTGDDGKIAIQFLQVNDVYEIAPIEGGKAGGMARVAAVKKELLTKNKNTYLVMAGDFLSPSVYNSLKYEGQRIRGKQMVETMNAAGVDMAAFGNHEFDISESELQSRINESGFKWISSNSFHKKGDVVTAFEKVNSAGIKETIPETYILNIKDEDGTTARIGFIGINITSNNTSFVAYKDPIPTAVALYKQIEDSCDAVVAITHQFFQDDIEMAKALPKLAAIIGGHEHDMRYTKVGNVVISKAHANARSVYITKMTINKVSKKVSVTAKLKMINDKIKVDSSTEAVVQKWTRIASENYASIGFDPNKIVVQAGDPLIARESVIRKQPTNFSKLIIKAMEAAAPDADVAVLNTGAIRLDDVLYPPFTEYDILRTMPFGGGIPEAEMKGIVLKEILNAGRKNIGIGGYLVYSEKLSYDTGSLGWSISGIPINDDKIYRVALTDYLLTGGEDNLNFLTKENPGITKIYPTPTNVADLRSDIRLAIIHFMKKK